jgi:hypothetical protein
MVLYYIHTHTHKLKEGSEVSMTLWFIYKFCTYLSFLILYLYQTLLLPPSVNPIAVKYISYNMSYHTITYHISLLYSRVHFK